MSYILVFIAGSFIGAIVGGFAGVATMCACIVAGEADDREERWFDDEH